MPAGVTDVQGAVSAAYLTATNPASLLAPPTAAAAGGICSTVLSALQTPYDALAENTMRHCTGLPAHHAVICGPPGAGKSWLLWEGTLLAGEQVSYGAQTAAHASCCCYYRGGNIRVDTDTAVFFPRKQGLLVLASLSCCG
jgi:hypothetical protein